MKSTMSLFVITELYDPVNNHAVRFAGYYDKVLKAVIDPSMKKVHLSSYYDMFYGGISDSWETQYLKNMKTIEGLQNLNTSIVTNMDEMFLMCSSLTTLDLSLFNTSNVTSMFSMFMDCSSLRMLDISSFDISNVEDMTFMFFGCSELTTIFCFDNWSNTSASTDYLFAGCNKLVGGKGTLWNSNFIDATYARPDGGTEAPGYFTAFVKGDVNCDGKIDIADAVTVLNAMAGQAVAGNADVNGDNKVDIADFVTVLNIMAGM